MSDHSRVTLRESVTDPAESLRSSSSMAFRQFDEMGSSHGNGKFYDANHGKTAKSAGSEMAVESSVTDTSNEPAKLREMFRKLACSLCEAMVSHTSELRIEATVGITVDGGARVVLVHFSERVSRDEDVHSRADISSEVREINSIHVVNGITTNSTEPLRNDASSSMGEASYSSGVSEGSAFNIIQLEIQDHLREPHSSSVQINHKEEIVDCNEDENELRQVELANFPQDSDQTLRQLFTMPPVLKWSNERTSVPSSNRNVSGVKKSDEVPTCKPSGRSTILGKLLTSKDSDSYLSMCHPQAVAAYPQFTSRPVPSFEMEIGCVFAATSAANDDGRSRRISAKRARNPDDDDVDWVPNGVSRNQFQRLQESSSNVSLPNSNPQAKTPSTARSIGSFQFSSLLHHLVARNLSANGNPGTSSSDSQGHPAVTDSSSFRTSLRPKDDSRCDYMSMNIKQEMDDGSYGTSNSSFAGRMT